MFNKYPKKNKVNENILELAILWKLSTNNKIYQWYNNIYLKKWKMNYIKQDINKRIKSEIEKLRKEKEYFII
jgi:hypothetical protein